MPNAKPPLQFIRESEIMVPEKERGFPVSFQDWEILKKKVCRIQSSGLFFHTIGSILLGTAGSAILTIYSVPDQLVTLISTFKIIFAACLIAGCLSLYFAFQQKKLLSYSKDNVLEEMDRIEKPFKLNGEKSNG